MPALFLECDYWVLAGGFATLGGWLGCTVTVAPLATPVPVVVAEIVTLRAAMETMVAPVGIPVAAIGIPAAMPVALVTGITESPAATAPVVVVVTAVTKLASVPSSARVTL